ncbi:MAG: hypothetical protein ACK4E1_07125 [Fervidobacterium nodosum]
MEWYYFSNRSEGPRPKVYLSNAVLYCFALSISFYAAKITRFSPIYIIYLLLTPVALFCVAYKSSILVSFDSLVIFFLLLYVILTQIAHIYSGEFINLFISLVAYLYIRSMRRSQNELLILKVLKIMNWVTISVLIIDTIYRLVYPTVPAGMEMEYFLSNELLRFYVFKFNSKLFADSNTVALIALILYFSNVFVGKLYKRLYTFRYEKIILVLLLIFTFSRAAYVAFVTGAVFMIITESRSLYKRMFYIGLILFLAVLFSNYALEYIRNDGSFRSKEFIIALAFEKIKKMSLTDLLVGVGMGESISFLGGIHTHIIFLTYFIETGAIGLFLFLVFVLSYISRYGALIFLPVIVVSFSYFLYLGTPFLFVPLALAANLGDFMSEVNPRQSRSHTFPFRM